MKTSLISVLSVTALVACSSDPSGPSGQGAAGQAGQAAGGQASATAGAAGQASAAAGATSSGAGGDLSGGAGSAGAPTAGAGGTVANAGSAGSSAGAGAGGTSGVGGSAGSVAIGGSGGSQIPPTYTGKPFGGTPQVIPGKIEIEKYDTGGLNVAFNADAGGPFNSCGFTRPDPLKLQCTQQDGSPKDKTADPVCGVEPAGSIYLGYIGSGNWYKYTVNVTESGTYVISGHEGVAGKTQMQFTFTDTQKTGLITLPPTSGCGGYEAYHIWATQDNLGELTLTAGQYVLQITSVTAAMNLDWFAFTKKP